MTTGRPVRGLSPTLEAELVDALADVILAKLRRVSRPTGVPPSGYVRPPSPLEPPASSPAGPGDGEDTR